MVTVFQLTVHDDRHCAKKSIFSFFDPKKKNNALHNKIVSTFFHQKKVLKLIATIS
jgi:hypothetical protein